MKRTRGGNIVYPGRWTYIFGGLSQLPPDQGGGYKWEANIIRRIRKYYREGWKDKYTLREWLR